MTNTVMDEYVLPAIVRYIDHYHWSFPVSKRLINMYYGTEYTEKELRALYRRRRKSS